MWQWKKKKLFLVPKKKAIPCQNIKGKCSDKENNSEMSEIKL